LCCAAQDLLVPTASLGFSPPAAFVTKICIRIDALSITSSRTDNVFGSQLGHNPDRVGDGRELVSLIGMELADRRLVINVTLEPNVGATYPSEHDHDGDSLARSE
jgi:hypothetical protein